MDETRRATLLVRLICQDLTEEEKVELGRWRSASVQNESFVRTVTNDAGIIDDLKVFMGMDKTSLLQKVNAGILEYEPLSGLSPVSMPQQGLLVRRLRPYLYWSAAAAILVCLILIYNLRTRGPGKENLTAVAHTGGPVDAFFSQKAPDSGSARLMLGDGSVKYLESMQEGLVAKQGGTEARLGDDGRSLKYAIVGSGNADSKRYGETYNTLTVPYGNRFKLELPDGTKVKLNVGSSIRFPVAFTGDKRVVELSGEAYFDVAPDTRHPFVVRARKEAIEVLGTEFVVSDYPAAQSAKVAVASGSVKVSNNKENGTVLHPSQGVNIEEEGAIKMDPTMDLSSILALKEDYFNFDGLDIKAAIWQLAQSYHMRVLFDDNIKSGSFGSGNIQRDLPLERLLKDLELPDLHFAIHMQDNTIVVTR